MTGAMVHGPGEGEANDALGLLRRIRIGPEATGGAFCLFEEEVPEGAGPLRHVHETEIELFTVLEGRLRFHCAGEEAEVGEGATVMIPAGAEHAFLGLGPGPARVLIMLSPGAGIGLFREVAAEGLHPPADMPRIAEIAARHGVRFTGPPLD